MVLIRISEVIYKASHSITQHSTSNLNLFLSFIFGNVKVLALKLNQRQFSWFYFAKSLIDQLCFSLKF